jgi:predicted ferric reductase
MSLRTKKLIFWFIWLFVILSGPVTVIRNSSLDVTFTNPVALINFFQRISGLLAFSLLFIQIVLGVHMNRLIQTIGSSSYKIHITQGLVAYGFMLVHPLFENALIYQVSKSITDTILVFIPRLSSERDIFLAFGRTALILATIAVFAAYFRTKPFFRRNWRAFHILNYLVFYLVFIHMRVGTDIATPPFSWVSLTAFLFVTASVCYRMLNPVYLKLKKEKTIKKEVQKA